MSTYINGSNNKNLFYFKEYIDKEKLISKILTNIESKIKVVEEFKNKYYNSNKLLENVIMSKFEFLEILNEFEETITQSLQGMRSLIVEIRNLKEKKEVEEKIIKNRNNSNYLIYNYLDKNHTQNLEYNDNKENIDEQIKGKNKSYCEQKEISLYTNLYGPKKNIYLYNNKYLNGTKNKLYYKNKNCSSGNIHSSSNKKKLNNNEIGEFESLHSYEDKSKIINNRNSSINLNKIQNKTYNKLNKNSINDSITEKNTLTYDLSIINDIVKENHNNSYILNNYKNKNKFDNHCNNNNNNINNKAKNKLNEHRILRLQLKNKNKNNKINNNNSRNSFSHNNNDNINIDDDDEQNQNNSMSKKYELELQNTNQEKSEKIEVEIKCPIRQGIRRNCRKNSAHKLNSNNDIMKIFNYNKNKQDIIEKINCNEKLKDYFAKKYGGNNYDLFLNKFWKNKLNANDIDNEVNIISAVIKKEEELAKKCEKNNKYIPYRNNNNEYEFKFLSKIPIQNIISKKGSNGNNNFNTIIPDKNSNNKYFNSKLD